MVTLLCTHSAARTLSNNSGMGSIPLAGASQLQMLLPVSLCRHSTCAVPQLARHIVLQWELCRVSTCAPHHIAMGAVPCRYLNCAMLLCCVAIQVARCHTHSSCAAPCPSLRAAPCWVCVHCPSMVQPVQEPFQGLHKQHMAASLLGACSLKASACLHTYTSQP